MSEPTEPTVSKPARLLRRLVDLREGEFPALAWSWGYIFAILASYYMLRPIRDQMGIAGGIENLPWLFLATLVGMLALNLPFAWLVKSLPRARFVPLAYRFFAANILLFAVAIALAEGESLIWVGRVFFVWLSIFNLFVVSIFWATIVDVFSTSQGKRLFGFIAAGATLGAVSGSAATAILARDVPTWALLIAAALLLEAAVFAMRGLARLSARLHEVPSDARNGETIGGGVLDGIGRTFRSPYLANIALFLVLYSLTSTFLYFQQAAITKAGFADKGAQTAFLAGIDLAVNVLTLVVQLFLTGRIVRALGVGPRGPRAAAGPEHRRLRRPRGQPDAGRLRRGPGAAPGRQLRDRATDPRGAVHGRAARGPLQGQGLHRHGRLPHRRPDRGVVEHRDQGARAVRHGGRHRRGTAVGGVADQRALARARAEREAGAGGRVARAAGDRTRTFLTRARTLGRETI